MLQKAPEPLNKLQMKKDPEPPNKLQRVKDRETSDKLQRMRQPKAAIEINATEQTRETSKFTAHRQKPESDKFTARQRNLKAKAPAHKRKKEINAFTSPQGRLDACRFALTREPHKCRNVSVSRKVPDLDKFETDQETPETIENAKTKQIPKSIGINATAETIKMGATAKKTSISITPHLTKLAQDEDALVNELVEIVESIESNKGSENAALVARASALEKIMSKRS